MAKTKYRINTDTLEFEKVQIGLKGYVVRGLAFTGVSLLVAFVAFMIAITYIDSPKEKKLKGEHTKLLAEYSALNKRIDDMEMVLKDIENRDDNIYRTIFEAEPIPGEVRQSGIGGSYGRYKHLETLENSELVVNTALKVDKIPEPL